MTTAKTSGFITINGIQYPIENFTITWTNPTMQTYYMNGSNELFLYDPTAETEEQKDERLNPRKYDTCKFCDHYRHRHELGYLKCHGTEIDWDYDNYSKTECDCKEFV